MSKANRKIGRVDRLIFALTVLALLGLWGLVTAFTLVERDYALEQARSQLETTVITLADFNELSRQAAVTGNVNDSRTDAIWRALLRYPAASIWVESGGTVTVGQRAADTGTAILVEDARSDFTVYAALPRESALSGWWRTLWQRSIAMALATVLFIVLAWLSQRAMRQRLAAEREIATARERNKQLSLYREQLEKTVAERTQELQHANDRLEEELTERKAAERTLREHDALLSSVTKASTELLGTHGLENAVAAVLELIGQTIAVSRVQLNRFSFAGDGHLHASVAYEWCAPGMDAMIDDLRFHDVDMTRHFPTTASKVVAGNVAAFHLDEISEDYREICAKAGMRSFLQIPVYVEGKLWGNFSFIDSSEAGREWNWAETDTLKTLADLVGVAMTRARYVKELSDANMIVQNSPTILYRLKGEPSFPLIYISHNITKFGHRAEDLVDMSDWMGQLVKDEDQTVVHKAMAHMLDHDGDGASIEFRLRTGDGDYRWVENRYTPVRDKNGRLKEVEGIIIDITERKQAEEKISMLARTDSLTGLANRATFIERLQHHFAAAKRGARAFAVLYLDLDHFKSINDTLGHPIGDKLLKEVADRLRNCTRETDVVARLGGDEFAVLQTEIFEPANSGTLAQNILKVLGRPYQIEGNELHVSTSVGISPYTESSPGPDAMLTQADLALYRAKEEGRNRYRFHSDDLDRLVNERVELGEELRRAIEKDELELLFQPQLSMATGEVVGMEALVRWRHSEKGVLEADDIVPVAEKTGTIMALGRWILNAACRQLHQWREDGADLPEVTLNLFGAQLKSSRELVNDIIEATDTWGLKPQDLELDVTEAMLAQATWTQNDVLNQLRRLGCKIAIDNFGTEYSSFDYLRSYSVNSLKISKPFIANALADPEWAANIRAIIHLARDLGIGVIIEGVETPREHEFLMTLGEEGHTEGIYYSTVVDNQAAAELLRGRRISTKEALANNVQRQES